MFLDAFLSFITFFIVVIKDFLGIFVFRPPNPIGYKTQMKQIEDDIKEVKFNF
jgi:hypothetical protein